MPAPASLIERPSWLAPTSCQEIQVASCPQVLQTVTVLKDPSCATHMVLDLVGMIPVVGEVADLINAGIYAAEGNYVDASSSLAGMVPFAGAAVTGARMVKNTVKTVNTALDVTNVASDAFRVAGNIPLNAVTPPLTTLGKLPEVPTVKVPDLPMVKAPDAKITRSAGADAPSTGNAQYASDDPRYYAASVTPGGHVSGEAVIAGHGELRIPNDVTIVPEGTRVLAYADDGDTLLDSIGKAVEGGEGPVPTRIYEAGESLPNYTITAPKNLNVLEDSIMVPEPTLLSELLETDMGNCHLAICLVRGY